VLAGIDELAKGGICMDRRPHGERAALPPLPGTGGGHAPTGGCTIGRAGKACAANRRNGDSLPPALRGDGEPPFFVRAEHDGIQAMARGMALNLFGIASPGHTLVVLVWRLIL